MSTTYRLTGGARVGRMNVTYPFATLKVDAEFLELDVSLIRNLEFQPKDIISIEPYDLIPILGRGIKINHRLACYSPKVIFWTFQEPESLIQKMKQIGFLPKINPVLSKADQLMLERQRKSENPVKPLALIVLFLFSLGIFINSFLLFPMSGGTTEALYRIATIGLSVIFLCCLLVWFSKTFRGLILSKERHFHEIKRFILFTTVLSGCILFFMLLIPVLGLWS